MKDTELLRKANIYGILLEQSTAFRIADKLDRLAAYEDAGLDPEEIRATVSALMGRTLAQITEFEGVPLDRLRELVEADKDGRLALFPESTHAEIMDEWIKAHADGRLVVLPVKPGGECFIIDGANRVKTVRTQTYPITMDVDGMVSPNRYFIDDIYLTRAEAEAALLKGDSHA